jgi:hypothetical protein
MQNGRALLYGKKRIAALAHGDRNTHALEDSDSTSNFAKIGCESQLKQRPIVDPF